MYCQKCGVQVDDQAAFCEKCGAALRNASAEVENPLPTDYTHIEYAGFWKRLAAGLIDGLLLSVAWFVVAVAVFMVYSAVTVVDGDDLSDSSASALLYLSWGLAFTIGWLFYAAMESSSKQATLGKMALGIVVTDMNGRRVSFGRATGRYFGKIVSSTILYIGYIMVAFTAKKQGLHDIMADCLVVVKKHRYLGNEEGTECTARNAERRTTTRLLSVTSAERSCRGLKPEPESLPPPIPQLSNTQASGGDSSPL